jgi:hypothetical protein
MIANLAGQSVPDDGVNPPPVRIVEDTAIHGGRELRCYVGTTTIATATLLPASTGFGNGRWSVLPHPAMERLAGTRAASSVVLDEDDARQALGFLAGLYLAGAPDIPRLHALGSYASSQGVVYSFPAGALPEGVRHARQLIGQQVLIDGLRFTVRGVEHWAIVCPRDGARCEHPFGLLVES